MIFMRGHFARCKRGASQREWSVPLRCGDEHSFGAEHFVEGDTGISKWYLTGTNRREEDGEVRGCDFYTFRQGQVIRKDSYWEIVE